MRTFILKGRDDFKQAFIQKIIIDNKIPNFNVFKYGESLGIASAKEIKKNIGIQAFDGARRVFIIENDLTNEAQNALLKILEELPEDNFFIFLEDKNLLPTIVSRCQIVSEEKEYVSAGDIDYSLFEGLTTDKRNSLSFVFSMLSDFYSEKREKPFEDLTLVLRKFLFDSINNQKVSDTQFFYKLLSDFLSYSSLVSQNNLNERFISERLFCAKINDLAS